MKKLTLVFLLYTISSGMGLCAMIPLQSQKTKKVKKLETPEDYKKLQQDLDERWAPIQATRKKLFEKDRQIELKQASFAFTPLFTDASLPTTTPPSPRSAQLKKLAREIQADVEKKWLLVEQKFAEKTCSAFSKDLASLKIISPNEFEELENAFAKLSDKELIAELTKLQTQEQRVKKGLLAATATGCVAVLQQQQVLDPVLNATRTTRNPFAIITTGLSLLDSSKKTVGALIGATIIYLGCKSAYKKVDNWLHHECREKEKRLEEEFTQRLVNFETKLKAREESLKKELERTTQQARENAFDALLKYDSLEKKTDERFKGIEKTERRTESQLIGLQQETSRLEEKCTKAISTMRKDHEKALKGKLSSLTDKIHSIEKKLKDFSKDGVSLNPTDAIAILSLEMQKLGEEVRELAPSRSRCPSRAESEMESLCSAAMPSPSTSIYSLHADLPPRPRPTSRPASAFSNIKKDDQSLQKILEERERLSSSDSDHEADIAITVPPVNLEQTASSSTSPKQPSPRRRRSICAGFFGKKDPKDAVDQRA